MTEMNAIIPAVNHMTRILIVDDDPGIRTLILGFLQRHGYHVDTAEQAVKMPALLEQAAYDLIALDVMMPGEDGLSVLRRVDREGRAAEGSGALIHTVRNEGYMFVPKVNVG